MRMIKYIFLLLVLSTSNVQAITIAQTTANYLNVRSSPNGDILFSLPKNSIVGVLQVKGNWAMVMYLPKNSPQSAKQGWVSLSYLKIVSGGSKKKPSYGISGDNCEYEYDSNAQVHILADREH